MEVVAEDSAGVVSEVEVEATAVVVLEAVDSEEVVSYFWNSWIIESNLKTI